MKRVPTWVQFVALVFRLGIELPLHEGRIGGALARAGGARPPRERRCGAVRHVRREASAAAEAEGRGHLLVVGLLLCVVPFLLFAWAERHISSSLVSVYNATTPLMTMAVAMLVLSSEPRTCDKTLGLLLGIVGVIVVLAPWNGLGHSGLAGQLVCLGATACYGMGFTYLRRFVTPLALPSASVAAVQVSLAAVVMLALTPIAATGAT